jgi:membrane-associated phospholipid phosphatase
MTSRLRSALTGLGVFLFFGFRLSAARAEDNPQDIITHIFHDQPRIVTSPMRADRNDVALWGMTSAAALGLAPHWNGYRSLDEQLKDNYGHASGASKSAWTAVTYLGSGEVTFGLAAAGYGIGYWQENNEMQHVSARWLEALADVGIWGTAVKWMTGRDRPGTGNGKGDFQGPSFSNSSFPSGHTTAAFATAAVFSHEYPTPWVVVPAYTIATGVGISRLALEKHWTSDVLVGAALGHSIGSLVMNRASKKDQASATHWTPWITAQSAGIAGTRYF